ncbi:MAG: KDO2-lipid IV(A) lauroyltransferase [Lysobacterales bacterium]|jgi:KDO2-lipid IV(A) lauroyltransferase
MPFVLNVLFRLLSLIPARVMIWLSHPLGRLVWAVSPTKKNSTEKNLLACYPDMNEKERMELGRESMRHYIFTVMETGKAWHWPRDRLRKQLEEPEGLEHLLSALAENKGVLALVPHFGAWEFSAQGFGETSVMALYKPGEHAEFDRQLLEKRLRQGTEMAATTRPGLKKIYQQLNEGGLVLQLPDQDPSGGQGRFVPFFGIPAWTGVLAPRLVQRTDCKVLFVACVRAKNGRYRMVFQPAEEAIYSADTDQALAALNRGVEKIIELDRAQYLWAYKRFKTRPEGEPRFY